MCSLQQRELPEGCNRGLELRCLSSFKAIICIILLYFNYFSNYTRYFKSRKWDSLQNRAPLEGAEAAYLHSSSGTIKRPVLWRKRRWTYVGGLDVFQPTSMHGWTKLISQGFNRSGDISAFVLPHVIGNSKIHAHLNIKSKI